MKYADLNLSSTDARVLEPILVAAFEKARNETVNAETDEPVRVLRAMLQRLRKLDI